jgi:hypothetical protein
VNGFLHRPCLGYCSIKGIKEALEFRTTLGVADREQHRTDRAQELNIGGKMADVSSGIAAGPYHAEHKKQINAILGPGNSRTRDPGIRTSQQIRMTLEVFEAVEAGDRLIIEAPTGTGKTLAYLVAAAHQETGSHLYWDQEPTGTALFRDIPLFRIRSS